MYFNAFTSNYILVLNGKLLVAIVFSGLVVIGLGCSWMLGETKGKVPENVIEELKERISEQFYFL